MSKERKEVSEGKEDRHMPIDNTTWTNCRKCGHRYADYMDHCPRCNAKTKHLRIGEPGIPSRRQIRFTTTHVFLICLSVLVVSLIVMWFGVTSGNSAIPGYSALAAGVSGAVVALIINRKMTKGLRRWWDRG